MMRMPFAVLLLVALLSGRVIGGTVPAVSPQGMAAALERRGVPFRYAEPGPSPDDDLYAPWRLVDVWLLSTTEHTEDTEGGGGASSPSEPRRLGPHAESAEFESHAESAENAEPFDWDLGFVDNGGQLTQP